MQARYWRIGFTFDPTHWVNVDCGKRVSESLAVAAAQHAFSGRGTVFAAIIDAQREPCPQRRS